LFAQIRLSCNVIFVSASNSFLLILALFGQTFVISTSNAQSWGAQTIAGQDILRAVNMAGNTNPIPSVTIGLPIGTAPNAQLHTTGTVRFAGITQDNTQTDILVRTAAGDLRFRNVATLPGAANNNWSLGGNTNLTAANNVLGSTTAAQSVRFWGNNVQVGTLNNFGLRLHPVTGSQPANAFVEPGDQSVLFVNG
jgi:hypothetical protein